MSWYLAALKKYITFRGRARRKEFWIYTLIDRLIQLILIGIFFCLYLQYHTQQHRQGRSLGYICGWRFG